MSNVLLEAKGIKQYFAVGRKINEKKNLNKFIDLAIDIFRVEYPNINPRLKGKHLFKYILDKYKNGEEFSDRLCTVLQEYEAISDIHGHKLYVKANDGIDITICKGETVGLVGESGCGKSTLGRTILKLYEPTEGEIFFDGKNITNYSYNEMRPLRQEMQIIFQDPYSALNPRMTVGEIIGEALLEHGIFKRRNDDFESYVKEIMKTCGLEEYMIYRYPHEFSGGQRQRIGIARALALKPRFIVCDEAVSALDVSIQSQIINLLKDLQDEFQMAYLFISHDLSVVKHISDRIGVMYLGDMVEFSDKHSLYEKSLHPYTKALLSAIPETDLEKARSKKRIILEGDIPSNIIVPTGCKFHTRCPIARSICKRNIPEFREVESGHFVACHFSGEEI